LKLLPNSKHFVQKGFACLAYQNHVYTGVISQSNAPLSRADSPCSLLWMA
jgi:hypothetical protein